MGHYRTCHSVAHHPGSRATLSQTAHNHLESRVHRAAGVSAKPKFMGWRGLGGQQWSRAERLHCGRMQTAARRALRSISATAAAAARGQRLPVLPACHGFDQLPRLSWGTGAQGWGAGEVAGSVCVSARECVCVCEGPLRKAREGRSGGAPKRRSVCLDRLEEDLENPGARR